MEETTGIRITVTNTSDTGGTALTPFWFGFHDGSFDLFESGEAASAGLEALAEDGNAAGLDTEVSEADVDAQSGLVPGAAGPIVAGEVTSTTVDVDGASNGTISLAAMLLPSNDAFVGTNTAVELFDESGAFLGAQTVVFEGSNVYDAGTEYNTEEDAAFINQTGPNTGVDENGVVRLHEGFNGSEGNPDGVLGNAPGEPGEQIILGGVNAFGQDIDPVAADFTREGAEVAEVHINTFTVREGTSGNNVIRGDESDDLVSTGGGRNFVSTGDGYDVIEGGDGIDVVRAGNGNDQIFGGRGGDFLFAGEGDDIVGGGAGNDRVALGSGDDTFVFSSGDGQDVVFGFDEGDTLVLDGVALDFDDVLESAVSVGNSALLTLGDGDAILLQGVQVDELTEDNVLLIA